MPGKSCRIIFLNHWGLHLGGAERSLLDILTCLSPQCEAHLITSESGPLTRQAQDLGISCRVIPCSLKPTQNSREHFLRFLATSRLEILSFFRFVYKMSTLVKRLRPDVIHANVPKSHIALFFLSRFCFRGTCIFHMREIFKKNSIPYFLYLILFPFHRGKIIAISESVKTCLPQRLQAAAMVIHNGVSISPTSEVRGRQLSSPTRFLYLGRIVPWKGCEELVDIFARLKNKIPGNDCSLSLIGATMYWDGKYRDLLTEKIRLHGISSSCFLLPHTENVRNAMQSHDIFCNASVNEPFGRSIAEAQAEAMPVIAFDSGALREIVGHEETGILVPLGDMRGFTEAMERLLLNKDAAKKMGMNGHERMKKYFNQDLQIPKISRAILTAADKAPLRKT
jgi:glycosyltransferase involved in cell wall biosynthesis